VSVLAFLYCCLYSYYLVQHVLHVSTRLVEIVVTVIQGTAVQHVNSKMSVYFDKY